MGSLFRSAVAAVAALVFAAGQTDAAVGAAASHAGPPPPPGVIVAGQSPGSTLTVADAIVAGSDRLELTLDVQPSVDFGFSERSDPPLWPDEIVLVSYGQDDGSGATRVSVGGAVSAVAAAVELGFAGGQVLRLPLLAGDAYTGRYAGRVRFFLGEVTLAAKDADDDPALVRMLDASGAVIGVARSPTPTRSVELLRRRAGGTLLRFNATLTSWLAPLPGAPERRADDVCLSVAVRGPVGEREAACQASDRSLMLGGRRGCGRVPTTLAGFAPAATRTLAVRLGSGRTIHLPTRAAPFGRPGRSVTAVLPRGEAIRKAWALDGAGNTLASGELLVAPPDRRCDREPTAERLEQWDFSSGDPAPRLGTPPGTEVAAAAGAVRLLVRDAGEQLCVGVDQLDLDGGDCFRPRFNGRQGDGGLYVDSKRGIVAGVYPAQVAAVSVRFRGGGTVRVSATDGLAYTGRYRGAVHFVFASTPLDKQVIGATLLDATGRNIGRVVADGPARDLTLIGRPSRALSVGSGRSAVRVVVGAKVSHFFPRGLACLGVEFGRARGRCDDDLDVIDANTVTARVTCGRRRTVVFGIARRAIRRVEITLANGQRVRPRLVAFPRASTSSVFLAVFPSRVAVTRVRFLGRHQFDSPDTAVLPTRAPARQCGYEASDSLP